MREGGGGRITYSKLVIYSTSAVSIEKKKCYEKLSFYVVFHIFQCARFVRVERLKNTGHTYNSGHQFSDNRKRRNADEDLNDKCLCAVGKWCIKANDEKLRGGGNAGEKRCLVRAGDRFVSKGNSSVYFIKNYNRSLCMYQVENKTRKKGL